MSCIKIVHTPKWCVCLHICTAIVEHSEIYSSLFQESTILTLFKTHCLCSNYQKSLIKPIHCVWDILMVAERDIKQNYSHQEVVSHPHTRRSFWIKVTGDLLSQVQGYTGPLWVEKSLHTHMPVLKLMVQNLLKFQRWHSKL